MEQLLVKYENIPFVAFNDSLENCKKCGDTFSYELVIGFFVYKSKLLVKFE